MADRRDISARDLARRLYIPEDDPRYRGYMRNGLEDYEDLAGAIGSAAMLAPPGFGGLISGAVNANRLVGGARAMPKAAPGGMRALPPPMPAAEPRAPMAREPVSTPDVIPMGGPLRDAPQIGYTLPEQRYQMAVDRPASGRAPTNYERPMIDEMYVPREGMNMRGDVVSDPGGIPTMNTEGKLPVSNAPRWANERLAQEQRIADMIAEGNVAPDAMRNARALSDRDEALFLARQRAQATDDGMGALPGQYHRQPGTAVVPAQTRQLQSIVDKHFGAPTVAQAEGRSMATGPTYFAEVPGSGPKLVGESFAGPQAPGDWYRYASAKAADATDAGGISPLLKYGMPAVLAGGAGAAGYNYASSNGAPPVGGAPSNAPSAAPAAGAPINPGIRTINGEPVYFSSRGPDINSRERFAHIGDSSNTPAEILGSRRDTASATDAAYGPEAGRQAAIDMVRGRPEFEQGPVGSGRGSAIAYPTNVEGLNNLISNMQTARTANAALDSRLAREAAASRSGDSSSSSSANAASPAGSGMLSKIFGQPATTKQLFQQSVDNPDDAGAWMRAERQYARTHTDPNFDVTKLNDQGMKRGGSAGGKQDSVHKALEIIHHLIAAR